MTFTDYDAALRSYSGERDLLVALACGVGACAAVWAGVTRRSRAWLLAAAVGFAAVFVGAIVDIGDLNSIDMRSTAPAVIRVGVCGGVGGCVASVAAAIKNKPTYTKEQA